MKKLMVLDDKNYEDDFPVISKYAVRALIRDEKGRLATQKSAKGEFKLPGGGLEAGETRMDALLREVREETGLLVLPDSIREIGEIEELREDIFKKGFKYEAHSYYYSCEVGDGTVLLSMTESEQAAGYHLEWEYIDRIISENERLMDVKWKLRDTLFLKGILKGTWGV